MSGRALQKMREDRDRHAQRMELIDVDDDGDEEEEDEDTKPSGGAFLAMMGDSSSDEESDEEEVANADESHAVSIVGKDVDSNQVSGLAAKAKAKADDENESAEEEEDLDAILAEFQGEDEEDLKVAATKITVCCFAELSAGLEARDLDYESVMRTMLLGGGGEESAAMASTSTSRRRQAFLFGPARDGWVRPPHYVGGGIGMTSYDQHSQSLPWPYTQNDQKEEEAAAIVEPKSWFTFMHSDTYKKDLESYREIQQSGDVNSLALFVADNPFVPEALLQLAKVVYQTSSSHEALLLLRRVIWIHECAALKSFVPHHINSNSFVDFHQKENEIFFQALFLLAQVSSIAGCMRSSLAISRYVLAMDPLRDPMGVLLALDHFALSSRSSEHNSFVVDFVDNCDVHLYYRDEEAREFKGAMKDMPNWAYSYALALYRLEQDGGDTAEERKMTSSEALVSAIRMYPTIVEEFLKKNEISTSGRSTQKDWPSVLESLRKLAYPPSQHPDYDPIVYHATKSASDTISKIFLLRSFKLWGGHDIQKWLYTAAVEATAGGDYIAKLPSPALQRYARADLADYEDRFRLLPAEANPLDPQLLQYALNIDLNRRRLLRRGNRAGVAEIDPLEALENRARAGNQGIVIGGPPTHNLDPDSPLVEILWQSMLPWNHVEGVQPPPR